MSLAAVERSASVRFLDVGMPELADPDAQYGPPLDVVESKIAHGDIFVAGIGGVIVGFAAMDVKDGLAHLLEIDVVPEHGGRGIGSALIEHVCARAKANGFAMITLSTFCDVPWNAPLYARRGFRIFDATEWGPDIQAVWRAQAGDGLDMSRRVIMVRDL